MTAWTDLLGATLPGREVEAGPGDMWLILRRSYTRPDNSPEGRDDRMTITVELVRSGSPSDPRYPPGNPRITDPKGA